MNMTNKIFLGLILALRFSVIAGLLLGCHADSPQPPKFDLGGKDLMPASPDWPANCQTAPVLPAPALSAD